jgi:hypothetical protein
MPATSQIIISSNTHNGANTDPIEVIGDPFKGDGYYGWGDGLHTVEVQFTNFVGSFKIQATLAADPSDSDWINVSLVSGYTIDTTGLVSETKANTITYTTPNTSVKSYNFEGNFVWIRAIIFDFTAGSVNRILYNH